MGDKRIEKKLLTKGTQNDIFYHRMKLFEWNSEKNVQLKEERGISFEDVIFFIDRGDVLDIVPHPRQSKYPGQMMFIVNIENYAYLVPFMESEEAIFLKTIIPSRKATRKYLKG